MDARHFGVAEANRYVPLLQRTFTIVRAELVRIQEINAALEKSGAPAPDRLAEERAVRLNRVQEELATLADLGIEVKAVDGLVDFRALLDGRTVYLCWRFGEERVEFWHELEAGYSGRQPIRSTDAFAQTYDA
ncbi:MAG TPA: DUF2203 domain-containing protein [Myxococcales bacterium]|jgi:hypothetical protein|nr:DUF2203 domain-containing protein [Myxococcales bacterium]